MGRQLRDYRLGSREARSKLAQRHNPYWREIIPGLHIGYRKGKRGGVWFGRKYIGDGHYKPWRLGTADDIADADGLDVLSFAQADKKARIGPTGGSGRQMQTVNDAMALYVEYQRTAARSPKATVYAVRKHIEPTIGRRKLDRLTIDAITDWHHTLAKADYASKGGQGVGLSRRERKRRRQATANRILTILKASLNYAEQQGKYTGPAPWKLVKPFKDVDATEHPYLDRDQAVRLQNACNTDFRRLVRGALETGCRYGELASMKVSDFNRDAGTVRVRESKSGKVRHVHLTDSGAVFFDEVTAGQKGSESLFVRADGQPWGKSHQQRPMRRACERAGLDPLPFKALRTTYGSLLAMAGTPLQVIAAAMGHADTRITEKHYAHLMPNYVADTVRANLPTFGETRSNVKRIRS